MAEPLSIFYRIGPPINDLDIVRQQHQREIVGTADDAEIVICRTCYIFDEPWPCAVARLVAIVDEQIAADRLARLADGPGPEERPDLGNAWDEAVAAVRAESLRRGCPLRMHVTVMEDGGVSATVRKSYDYLGYIVTDTFTDRPSDPIVALRRVVVALSRPLPENREEPSR